MISGNGGDGISLFNGGTGHKVRGNYIGVDVTGSTAIGNGSVGVRLQGPDNNTIGGTAPGAGNVISGNDQGIYIASADTTDTVIQGNLIGTDVSGSLSIPNGQGIKTDGPSTIIGGPSPGVGNLLSGNSGEGIQVTFGGTNTVIQGNYIGTDITGSVALNNGATGVLIGGGNVTVWGTGQGEGNVISNSGNGGVILLNSFASGAVVQGNYIGTNASGTAAMGNAFYGVIMLNGASNNTIGGTATGAGNVISGNNGQGLRIYDSNSTGNSVIGNLIGTQPDGVTPLGNADRGVLIYNSASDNTVSSNTIAYNGGNGIMIYNSASNNTVSTNTIAYNGGNGIEIRTGSTGNAALTNSIHSNAGLGIDLNNDGVTANDTGDGDTGANNLQNFPVLTSALWASSGVTRIYGTLNTTANMTTTVELFLNAVCHASGYGEGETLLDTITIVTDGNGDATFSHDSAGLLPLDYYVTATATDYQNNTSEFSACVQVVRPAEVPGLTAPGLVAAAGLLAVVSAWGLRRRRRIAAAQ